MSDDDIRREALRNALTEIRAPQLQIQESLVNLDKILQAKADTGARFLVNETQGEVLRKTFGWDAVIRREYGAPDGRFQGKFFCSKDDDEAALSGEPSFWIRVVLPQMYANRRPDVFNMIGGLPEDDWLIGMP